MSTRVHGGIVALAWGLAACGGGAEYQAPEIPPPPPPPPVVEPAPLREPYAQQPATAPAPPASGAPSSPPPAAPAGSGPTAAPEAATPNPPAESAPLVYSYPTGQWVYTADHGWVWVPAGATSVEMEGAPYVYLYTPRFGWTWYMSPWGWGPYRYGIWVRHPWHPGGWHGYWVAHPRVVVRLGPRHFRR